MEDNEPLYHEWTASDLDAYYEGIAILHMKPHESVPYALDNSTHGWAEHPKMCVAAVVILSIVSVREGFLPDYLQALLGRLRDISDLLDNEERACYRHDLRTLEVLMEHVPYEVTRGDDDYWAGIEDSVPVSVAK